MADIEFYNATRDEWDDTKNGGDITDTAIESGVAHSFMLPTRPALVENGGERYFKFYIKATADLITLGIDIGVTTTSPTEDVYLAEAGSDDEVEHDLDKDKLRIYGGFVASDYDSDNKKVTTDRDVSGFVKADDKVTFYKDDNTKLVSWDVDSVADDGSSITFKKTSDDDVKGLNASSTITFDSLDKDAHKGFWIKQVVQPFTKPMEDPLDEYLTTIWYDVK